MNCPTCNVPLIPISYGMPTRETWERIKRGELCAGGCVETLDSPTHACPTCPFRYLDTECEVCRERMDLVAFLKENP